MKSHLPLAAAGTPPTSPRARHSGACPSTALCARGCCPARDPGAVTETPGSPPSGRAPRGPSCPQHSVPMAGSCWRRRASASVPPSLASLAHLPSRGLLPGAQPETLTLGGGRGGGRKMARTSGRACHSHELVQLSEQCGEDPYCQHQHLQFIEEGK